MGFPPVWARASPSDPSGHKLDRILRFPFELGRGTESPRQIERTGRRIFRPRVLSIRDGLHEQQANGCCRKSCDELLDERGADSSVSVVRVNCHPSDLRYRGGALHVSHEPNHALMSLAHEPRLGPNVPRAIADALGQAEPIGEARDDVIAGRSVCSLEGANRWR
jgi:hypothetical protein